MASRTLAVPRSHLSKVLEQLNAGHKPHLQGVKSLKLKYAFRNDHWGARSGVRVSRTWRESH